MLTAARDSCLQALLSVARSARTCAGADPGSERYTLAVDSARRTIERAQSHYETCRKGHAPTEREVRLVLSALGEGRSLVHVLSSPLASDTDTLDRLAAKVERAVARAGD